MDANSSDRRIRDLLNLGPASEEMLSSVGIKTESGLRKHGAVEVFIRVRNAGLNPSLNLLYAMEGALTDVKWDKLTLEQRMDLDLRVNLKRGLSERD